MQHNRDREQEQVHQIPDLILMNMYYHNTTPTLVPAVSDDDSDDYYIVAPQVSEGESLGNNLPPASPIPPDPPDQQSPEQSTEVSKPEEAPEGETPVCPVWECDKNNSLIRASICKILYAMNFGRHQQPVNTKQLSEKFQR